jgi:hypothetical protein
MVDFGPWAPETLEDRIDRLESLASIELLPRRYAHALDSRDISTLVTLFSPNVRVGADQSGRDALRTWFLDAMSKVRTTIHVVMNHVVDFDGPEKAHGIVYCRDEVEYPASGEWKIGMLLYRDTYRRVGGTWVFERRKFHRWYQVDALQRPSAGAGLDPDNDPITTVGLPDAFPTWAPFWAAASAR